MKSKTEAPDQDIHGVVPRLKKDTPPRTIPVDNETLDLVKRLRRRNKELDFPVGDNDYIFWANNRYTNCQSFTKTLFHKSNIKQHLNCVHKIKRSH